MVRIRSIGRPAGRAWAKVVVGIGFVGVAAWAVCWGRGGSLPQAEAAPVPSATNGKDERPSSPFPSDYSQRVVAYYNGNIPVTREMLGEYLIARQGADRLELLVNKCIIEYACRQKGVEVTGAEVDAALAEDLKGMGSINPQDFVAKVLKPYQKTLYEWKEDVIRPKLALTKLCRSLNRVQVTQQDLEDGFQAHFGEKIDCRIIMWPKNEHNIALTENEKIRESEEEFNRKARGQASGTLAAKGGQIEPFGRHTTGNEELEKEAFSLHPGEISRLIGTPEGDVVLKCVARLPADKTKSLEAERANLEKEIFDKKVQLEIPKLFQELRAQAQPKLMLKKYTSEEDLLRDVREELNSSPVTAGPANKTPPQGN